MYRNAGSAGRAHRAIGKSLRHHGGIPYAEPLPPIEPGIITMPGELAAAAESARRAILTDPNLAIEAAASSLLAAAWHSKEARYSNPGPTRTHHETVAKRFLRDATEYTQAARECL